MFSIVMASSFPRFDVAKAPLTFPRGWRHLFGVMTNARSHGLGITSAKPVPLVSELVVAAAAVHSCLVGRRVDALALTSALARASDVGFERALEGGGLPQ